jgi:hypothetical protein
MMSVIGLIVVAPRKGFTNVLRSRFGLKRIVIVFWNFVLGRNQFVERERTSRSHDDSDVLGKDVLLNVVSETILTFQ